MKLVLAACLVTLVAAGGVAPAGATDTAVLKAAPKRVNFGTKAVGTFTVKGATITNTGATDVLVQTSALLMPDQFSWGLLPGQTCPIFSAELLAAGASCDVVAGFRPEEFFAGREETAALQVTAIDPATGAIVDSIAVEFRGVGRT